MNPEDRYCAAVKCEKTKIFSFYVEILSHP